jgi:hypothetical protein
MYPVIWNKYRSLQEISLWKKVRRAEITRADADQILVPASRTPRAAKSRVAPTTGCFSGTDVSVNRERGESAEECARNGSSGTSDRIRSICGASVPRSAARPHAKRHGAPALSHCHQNDDAPDRLLPTEHAQVDVTCARKHCLSDGAFAIV